MKYIDTSVLLAFVKGEPSQPPAELFEGSCWSSRLIEVEAVVSLRRLERPDLIPKVDALLSRFVLLELTDGIVARARAFRKARALDAIHVATACDLRARGADVRLLTYDNGMAEAAQAEGLSAGRP